MATYFKFEWDEAKRLANAEKHGIDFADVRHVFDDAGLLVLPSTQQHDESRFLAVGVYRGRLVTVVYTLRGDRLRLISARRARLNEVRLYEHKRDDGQVRG